MEPRRIIVTGSSGFVGRHLLELLQHRFRVYGVARRSQNRSGAPVHQNISWYQVDIADRRALERAFHAIGEDGGADTVIHLAAHYDFTGIEHEEYFRTNVEGTRNVLDCSRELGIHQFIFSSSVAASRFPPEGTVLNEQSAPDGEHIYARTKRIGEEMLDEYRDAFRTVIVRFAALFSDLCEYPPVYMFLDTWLSDRWNRRLLGGHGASAVPYLHVKDVPLFFLALFDQLERLEPRQVLIASPDWATSHDELFEAATREFFRHRVEPIHMPRALCRPGMLVRDLLGRVTGDRPFERPWMADYIDKRMDVDASFTRRLLDWEPRPRLELLRRMPFLIENLKSNPHEWHRANRAAMKTLNLRSFLRLHTLLEKHEDAIAAEFDHRLTSKEGTTRFPSYQAMNDEQRQWYTRLTLHQLMNAVRTRERAIFSKYCGDLAAYRYSQGFPGPEVCESLEMLNAVCFKILLRDAEGHALKPQMIDHITVTLRAGCDQAQETFENLEAANHRGNHDGGESAAESTGD